MIYMSFYLLIVDTANLATVCTTTDANICAECRKHGYYYDGTNCVSKYAALELKLIKIDIPFPICQK